MSCKTFLILFFRQKTLLLQQVIKFYTQKDMKSNNINRIIVSTSTPKTFLWGNEYPFNQII